MLLYAPKARNHHVLSALAGVTPETGVMKEKKTGNKLGRLSDSGIPSRCVRW